MNCSQNNRQDSRKQTQQKPGDNGQKQSSQKPQRDQSR